MNNKLIEKIKSRGYWRVNFRPIVYNNKISSLEECKNIVEKNLVQFRGWNYPHFPRKSKDTAATEVRSNYYIGWIDWDYNKEFWHMYQSGQFLHYLGLREDWVDESNFANETEKEIQPGTRLEIIGAVFQLTEMYEFLSRLSRVGIYDEGVIVDISLNNTTNRILYLGDRMRIPLDDEYKATMEKIEFKRQYTKDEIITKSNELALEAVRYFFDLFGWHRPPMQTLKNDQDRLLKR